MKDSEKTIEIPAWVLVRLFNTVHYADGYCEGLGKPCAYLKCEIEGLDDTIMELLSQEPK